MQGKQTTQVLQEAVSSAEGTPFEKLMKFVSAQAGSAGAEQMKAIIPTVAKVKPCLELIKNGGSNDPDVVFQEYEKLAFAYDVKNIPLRDEFDKNRRGYFTALLVQACSAIPNANVRVFVSVVDELIAQGGKVSKVRMMALMGEVLGIPPEFMSLIITNM